MEKSHEKNKQIHLFKLESDRNSPVYSMVGVHKK